MSTTPQLTLDALLPAAMAEKAEQTGVKKAHMDFPAMLALSVLAGIVYWFVYLRGRKLGAGSQEPGAGSREPGAGSREPGARSREPSAVSRQPSAVRVEGALVKRKPAVIAEFLAGRRLAVAGVSKNPQQAANHVFRKLRGAGYEVVPLNPGVAEIEGTSCYPDVGAVPGGLDGVVIATHPRVALEVVRSCAEHGVRSVWFHRSFGQGSVAPEAVRECEARGLACIVGGCPLMYVEPVDVAHRCMRWFLGLRGRVPR